MAPPAGGTRTPISTGLVARLSGAARLLFTGNAGSPWFGPGEPLDPIAQDTAGRAFDFPTSYNITQQPRAGEPIGFAQLRGLADGSDIVRLAIETRKDQMEKLEWTIRNKDTTEEDDRAKALKGILQVPDLEHEWSTWIRMLLEDLLVIDAPTIYPRKTVGGQLYALEVVDGATIKRVLDQSGRTPMPPDPAYQQILKGFPASDFTREELIYLPRNPRAHKVYGLSPVEQIILTVNTAIRRAVGQLEYYTEGNIPDAFASTPEGWTPKQISDFQVYFEALMAGPQNSAQKRRIKFLPGKVEIKATKTEPLFDAGDEWLARVVCYAFSLPPNAFVKQQNRATAVSANEVALEEGLAPLMQWVKRCMNRVIAGPLRSPGYDFEWDDPKDTDQLTQAQIDQVYITTGVKTVNEVREQLNMEPLTPEELAANKPAPPVMPGAQPGQPGAAAASDPDNPTPSIPPAPGNPASEKFAKARPGRRAGRSLRPY